MFRERKMNYRGHAEFKMPRNYVTNDSYPMLSREEIEDRILESYKKIDSVVADIKAGNKPLNTEPLHRIKNNIISENIAIL